ncbi:MAG: tetratricopeptide repeat protein [Bacteroidetes bacterium]|nr:tetratricopeptide repeat protein [Bacteroidota bacterium]
MKTLLLTLMSTILTASMTLASETEIQRKSDSCMFFLRGSQMDRAAFFSNEIKTMAFNMNDSFEKGEAMRIVANFYLEKPDYDSAVYYFDLSSAIASQLLSPENDLLKARINFSYSLMFYRNGDFEKAIEMLLEAEYIFTELNDKDWIAETCNRLGGIYLVFGNAEKAKFYNLKAYNFVKESSNVSLQSKVLNAYGNYLLESGKVDSAMVQYDLAISIAKKSGNKKIISDALYNKAFAFSKQEEYEKVLHYYNEALEWARSGNLNYDVVDALYKYGLTLYYLERFDPARDSLQKALKAAKEMKTRTLQRNIYDALNFLEYETGNYKTAYEYLGSYVDLAHELFTEDEQKHINYLQAKFESQKKESQLIIQQQKIRQRNLIILISLTLLISLSAIILLMLSRHRKKRTIARQQIALAEEQVARLKQEQALLSAQASIKGEENERTRIARDLHDGLGGMLSGVKLTLNHAIGRQVLEENQANQFYNVLEMIDNSVAELRRIAHNMMPETLIRCGLRSALEQFCEAVSPNEKPKISFSFFGDFFRLEKSFELMVYRLVQEMTTNAIRHAEASEIKVELIQNEEYLSIRVIDNGKGFDQEKLEPNKGNGLRNLQSRVASFGGMFDLSAEIGGGTEVMASFDNIYQFKQNDQDIDC